MGEVLRFVRLTRLPEPYPGWRIRIDDYGIAHHEPLPCLLDTCDVVQWLFP